AALARAEHREQVLCLGQYPRERLERVVAYRLEPPELATHPVERTRDRGVRAPLGPDERLERGGGERRIALEHRAIARAEQRVEHGQVAACAQILADRPVAAVEQHERHASPAVAGCAR